MGLNESSKDRVMKKEKRPGIWIGHFFRKVKDVKAATAFFNVLGMRVVMETTGMAILELRGGTHLLLFKKSGKTGWIVETEFDLMVEDIKKFHALLKKKKIPVSPLKKDSYHLTCKVTSPDGEKIAVFSDHTNSRSV